MDKNTANDELTQLALKYLNLKQYPDSLHPIDTGGTSAVFKIQTGQRTAALKVYQPDLFHGQAGNAERRRLKLQTGLIGHDIEGLIDIYAVEETLGTAFIEMEYLNWQVLSNSLKDIPDTSVQPLFSQLVNTVLSLASKNIVHRDIKPANILVDPHFEKVKLLDLGVAREHTLPSDLTNETDYANKKPFLATAQYSAPEYLFRTTAPSKALWEGLNIYQLGAVLHDLIMKKELFHDEAQLGNKWLMAKAVSETPPDFEDISPSRLSQLKYLSQKCLTKKIETRLTLVTMSDLANIECEGETFDLKSFLNNNLDSNVHSPANDDILSKRRKVVEKCITEIKTNLVSACSPTIGVIVSPDDALTEARVTLDIFQHSAYLIFELYFKWSSDLSDTECDVSLVATLAPTNQPDSHSKPKCFGQLNLVSDPTLQINDICQTLHQKIKTSIQILQTSPKISEPNSIDV